MPEYAGNENQEINTYLQLDKALRKIQKKKYPKKKKGFLLFIKNHITLYKDSKLYEVREEFVKESTLLINSFYNNNVISFNDMLIRKDKKINIYEFKNTIKLPTIISFCTGILVSAILAFLDRNSNIAKIITMVHDYSIMLVNGLKANYEKIDLHEGLVIGALIFAFYALVVFSIIILILTLWLIIKTVTILFSISYKDELIFITKYEIMILDLKLEENLKKQLRIIDQDPIENPIIECKCHCNSIIKKFFSRIK